MGKKFNQKPSILTLQNFTKRVAIVFAIFSIGVLLFFLTKSIIQILLILFASALFSTFLLGCSRWFSARTKIKEGTSLVLVIVFIVVFSGIILWIIGPSIAEQSDKLAESLPNSFNQLKEQVGQHKWGKKLLNQIPDQESIGQEIGKYSSKIFSFVSSTVGVLVDFLIFIVFSIFIAFNPKTYSQGILYMLPPSKRNRGNEILDALSTTLFRWLSGRILDMMLVGLATGIGLWIIGVPLALTLGIITAILSFIPNIGPILALIPPLLLSFTQNQTKALYVVILFIVIQLAESYFLTPKIQKKAIAMPPVILLTAQLIFAHLLGGLGLLLATPLMASIMVMVKMLYIEDTLHDYSLKDIK